jgi:hypothetical protein
MVQLHVSWCASSPARLKWALAWKLTEVELDACTDTGHGLGNNFVTYFSPALLDGWVKQSSPACAAASTAGAWNGLMAWHRHSKLALDQDKVVAVMKAGSRSCHYLVHSACRTAAAALWAR